MIVVWWRTAALFDYTGVPIPADTGSAGDAPALGRAAGTEMPPRARTLAAARHQPRRRGRGRVAMTVVPTSGTLVIVTRPRPRATRARMLLSPNPAWMSPERKPHP